ncbi:MAG: arginine--tRNA ligase [Candidatus Bathyarchaeia archaeon]
MFSRDPWGTFREECRSLLRECVRQVRAAVTEEQLVLQRPPGEGLGELSSSLCLSLARERQESPLNLAQRIAGAMDTTASLFVREVKVAPPGYINFYADRDRMIVEAVRSAVELDREWGFLKVSEAQRIIVEHTSVNPTHPIDIGHARNTFLGDALARILKARGHNVSRHYYVDDVGGQMAVIAYAYEKLGRKKPDRKPDEFIGELYTVASCILEIERLKQRLQRLSETPDSEEAKRTRAELDEWVSVAAEVKPRHPELFDRLLEEVRKDPDPWQAISALNKAYEDGEETAKALIRTVAELCLDGFKQSLDRVGVSFDSWDWESELAWSSQVGKVLSGLRASPYVSWSDGVLELDAERAAVDLGLKEMLGLPKGYAIPSLTLTRSGGMTLYATRDIAYSLKKFESADRVINVVGADQTHPQIQLKVALAILGFKDLAARQHHFSYGFVRFPGVRMSSRRGRYVTLDQVLDEAESRARKEVERRSPELDPARKKEIARIVGMGAVKYALTAVEPIKEVVFTWDRVLDFERNSGPFIQYSHARACSILRKAGSTPRQVAENKLKRDEEQRVGLAVARFPEVFTDAADNLRPNLLPEFANELASLFNTFYDKLPVLRAESEELKAARLCLVEATRITLRNCLEIIGIDAPESM